MRFILAFSFCFLFYFSNAQKAIEGKWKPVIVNIDSIVVINLTTDSIFYSKSFEENLKGDKDPAASKELMEYVVELMKQKMKNSVQEFLVPNIYKEIDESRGKSNIGTYQYNNMKSLLKITVNKKETSFSVTLDGNKLSLTSKAENFTGKKGKMIIEYIRL